MPSKPVASILKDSWLHPSWRARLAILNYCGDAIGAQEFLFSKFDRHQCEEKPKKYHPV
jgi:hypothetical protein